jgi:hypothetical protein
MREAAITAGLVQSSRAGDRDWRDRLRIITYVVMFPRYPPYPADGSRLNHTHYHPFLDSPPPSEPEAAAVHCAHLTDLHKLQPNQNFMICDAGGGTVVRDLSPPS